MRITSCIIVLLILSSIITSCESVGATDQATSPQNEASKEETSMKPPAAQVDLGEVLVHFDDISDSLAVGTVKASLHNASEQSMNLYIQYSFTDSLGNIQHFKTRQQELEAGQRLSKTRMIEINTPEQWTPEDSQPYQIAVSIFADGIQVNSQDIHSSIQLVEHTETAFNHRGNQPDPSCMPVRNSVLR